MSESKSVLQDAIDEALSSVGFNRRGAQWLRESPDVVQSVELQKSQFGAQYYVNLGVWLKALGRIGRIRDKDMHIRLRADALLNPLELDAWVKVLDLDRSMARSDRAAQVASMIRRRVIPQLETWQAAVALRHALEHGDLREAFVRAEARVALAAIHD